MHRGKGTDLNERWPLGIEIGDFSWLSSGARLFSASDDFDGQWMASCNVPAQFTEPTIAPINIGRHVAVGANVVILPGVEIGDGAAICPTSYIGRSLGPWGLYAGIPARRVRGRSSRVLVLEAEILGVKQAA